MTKADATGGHGRDGSRALPGHEDGPAASPAAAARIAERTAIVKHSLLISGHATSISLEDAFWTRLRHLAIERGQSIAALVAVIDESRGSANLSSAIRVFLLEAAGGPQASDRD